MKIIVAMDSFKGSLTSREAGAVVRDALQAYGLTDVSVFPLSDGGEGMLDTLVAAPRVSCSVSGPLGSPVTAEYGVLPDGTAVIEAALANGLTLVPLNSRDPEQTTSCGVGELIRHAVTRGHRRFLLGIGGSATNDGGLGMLKALGMKACDTHGTELRGFGRDLYAIASLDASQLMPELKDCTFRIACDVENPLLGKNGCSYIFAPQKGADAETVQRMDAALARFADLTAALTGYDHRNIPGAGAAGGLGFAFLSYLPASLESGADLIMETTGLKDAICSADLVITGEGKLDSQTCMGKGPGKLAALAKAVGKPVWAFSGRVDAEESVLRSAGFDRAISITPRGMAIIEAMQKPQAKENLYQAVLCCLNEQ